MQQLTTEASISDFQVYGATRCVVIPSPGETTLDDVLAVIKGAIINNEEDEEAGDDLYIVRLGEGPQQSLSLDKLQASLRVDNDRRE